MENQMFIASPENRFHVYSKAGPTADGWRAGPVFMLKSEG
jgi:hypothetical protein